MTGLRTGLMLTMMAIVSACGGSDGPAGPTAPSGTSTLDAPVPQSPTGDVQLTTLRPTLIVRNSGSSGGTRSYEFQIADRSDFAAASVGPRGIVASQTGVPEGSDGTTSFTPSIDLPPSTRLYWRARAAGANGTSDWSATAEFRTKIVGFNRVGELYDPLTAGETIGTRAGSTTFVGSQGLRIGSSASWVKYQLAATLTSGEISVEVSGLQPNGSAPKARIFSMMDGGSSLFLSKFLFNVQYRGADANPDNAISYKVLMGDSDLKFEPDLAARRDGVRLLNPNTTYLWTATWGGAFRLTVREGGASGPIIYERSQATEGTYNPSPHTVYLGSNDAAYESGSYAGATYRNLWVGNRPRPSTLGSALHER
jgi:hypothetical protein